MKVLIVGGGGREHALAWKAAQSPEVEEVLVAPGNAGTAGEPRVRNVPIAASDLDGLLDLARRERVELTLIGPEQPLVDGVADRFREAGLACFGPSADAARLEGSKAYTKEFLRRHGIPTADSRTFTELEPALDWVRTRPVPIVVKADGLAAGKGVVVAGTREQAEQALREMLSGEAFGTAGRRVVVEEFMAGEEVSFMVMAGEGRVLALPTSQDHKARDDADRGPNTGGMGAYSPAPRVDDALHSRIMQEIIEPTLRGLQTDGIAYTGFLYAGLMISPQGDPKVVEYNCRFGDPETQPIIMRMRTDLVVLCRAALDGRLHEVHAQWDRRAALGVVMAAEGYPGSYRKGDVIEGLEAAARMPDTKVFHAGTTLDGDRILTSGGRVLCVTALGDDVRQAQQRAYRAVETIRWRGAYYRRDIGYRAVAREDRTP